MTFVWSKIEQRFVSKAEAFRFFDSQKNGKLSKQDLVSGLSRLKIRLKPNEI